MPSIKKNFAYNILLNITRVIFPLITAPYVSRILDPDGIGIVNFANTYASYFALFACLGTPTYGVRETAKRRDSHVAKNDLVSELLTISTVSTIIVTIAFLITVFFIPQLSENKIIFLIAGFVLYLAPVQIDWYYSGLERFGFLTFRNLVIRVISIACIFIFVKTKADLIIYVALGALGTIGGNIWNYIVLLREGIKPIFKRKNIKQHIKPLSILFTSAIAISIYTILDTLMLGFISDYSEVGYYTQATHISKTVLALVTSLSAVAIPRMAYYAGRKEFDKINDLASKSFSIISLIATPASFGLCCIAFKFIPLFYGEEFVGSIIPMMIMSFIIMAIGLNNLTGAQILLGLGHDKPFMKSVIFGTISNFSLNLILIPFFGAIGAAISSLFAEILILFVMVYYVYKKTNVRFAHSKSSLTKSLVGSLLFIPITYAFNLFLKGWIMIIVTIFICSLVYILIEKLLKHPSLDLMLTSINLKIVPKTK